MKCQRGEMSEGVRGQRGRRVRGDDMSEGLNVRGGESSEGVRGQSGEKVRGGESQRW